MNFKCKVCQAKDKQIDFLEKQNKDLMDRLMAFNKEAFTYYNAEKKDGPPLYPIGQDKDGKEFSYKDMDLPQAKDEIYRAIGEETYSVEEKIGEVK